MYRFSVLCFGLVFLFYHIRIKAQDFKNEDSTLSIYRSTSKKINNLIHTKLDITPHFENQTVEGKAWLTLKPHFYSTDKLTLDAKGMYIHKVQWVVSDSFMDLKYVYDENQLQILLPRLVNSKETYMIYIHYTAKPNERKTSGSAAITSDKGFYFINPQGEEINKPTQIWTQGETHANSVWFPTIDQPNQRTTQELYITVPKKFRTLSNGILETQTLNGELRTDYWVMDKPHAPYLFFVGVGDYAVVLDKYKDIEVSYFVEKEYESVAQKIFGETPKMMEVYEKLLGVEYPWSKYAQIVGRDYVSGAMENTTATLHMESAQRNARELVDGNPWEYVIAHELFHHWFGDLVTTESWSNLTLNESFANYGEYLWLEHRYGKTEAEVHRESELASYYARKDKHFSDLVRFHYVEHEDMFDVLSYNKGGAILHMLRNYVGDEAFFSALHLYLERYKYQSVETHQLRLVFEEIVGEDLNWFFNQWYYGYGHPKLQIKYDFNDTEKKATVSIEQIEKQFILPCKVDIHYANRKVERKDILLKKSLEEFEVGYDENGKAPVWISVDADKVWIAETTNFQSLETWLYQLEMGNYKDRSEAIVYLKDYIHSNKKVKKAIWSILEKSDHQTQLNIMESLREVKTDSLNAQDWKLLISLAENGAKKENPLVQAEAMRLLEQHPKLEKWQPLFQQHIFDSSYSVAGACLSALYKINKEEVIQKWLPELKKDARGVLQQEILHIICDDSSMQNIDYLVDHYSDLDLYTQAYFITCISSYLSKKIVNQQLGEKIIDGIFLFYHKVPKPYFFLKAFIDDLKKQNAKDAETPSIHVDLLPYFQKKFDI